MTPIKLRRFWEGIRTSYWFVPAVMSALAIALGFIMVRVDEALDIEAQLSVGLLHRTGTEGTRAVLATIAGSMITVGATVFSITIVALSLASQQYGPRLLRNFMRDTSNQVVLGTFTSTFLYCLLVLRTVSDVDDARFVPHLSVGLGVLLAVASLGVLIYFIHHVAVSIQVSHVTSAVAEELDEQIDTLFPEQLGEDPADHESAPAQRLPPDFDRSAVPVCFDQDGYMQAVDDALLLRIAVECDLVIRLACRPGDFVYADDHCALIWPRDHADERTLSRIRDAVTLGPTRNPVQDAEFAINQLVEVALRALSPSLNDPFTAITCIDRLGAGLAKLAQRRPPSPQRLDESGRLRVVVEPFDFSRLARAAFDPIRQYDTEHHLVASHLVRTIEHVASKVRRPDDRAFLLRQAQQVREQHGEFIRDSHLQPPTV